MNAEAKVNISVGNKMIIPFCEKHSVYMNI